MCVYMFLLYPPHQHLKVQRVHEYFSNLLTLVYLALRIALGMQRRSMNIWYV